MQWWANAPQIAPARIFKIPAHRRAAAVIYLRRCPRGGKQKMCAVRRKLRHCARGAT